MGKFKKAPKKGPKTGPSDSEESDNEEVEEKPKGKGRGLGGQSATVGAYDRIMHDFLADLAPVADKYGCFMIELFAPCVYRDDASLGQRGRG